VPVGCRILRVHAGADARDGRDAAQPRVRDDLILLAAYLVALALFGTFLVTGDGTFYYDLTRRFVGHDGIATAYQWGTSVWNAPFYLLGHALGLPAVAHVERGADRFRDSSITVAASVAALGAVLVGRRAVARLGLPTNAVILLGALFGTELWFYGVLEPSYTHAVDALAFSVSCYLVVRLWQEGGTAVAALLGASLVALVCIRYANLAALPGLLVPVVARRELRPLLLTLAGGLAAVAVLFAFPVAAGTGFGSSADFGKVGGVGGAVTGGRSLGDLLIPLRMLVAPDRGLLAYAPLCGVALVGFALALRARPTRVPIASIGLAALGILLVYIPSGNSWRGGGYSYGQRFLTSLTVITLIGLAELARRAPRLTTVLVVLGVAWSLFVGINFAYGWQGMTNRDRNVNHIVRLYTSGERTPWQFVRLVAGHLHDRFT
jgi:hypothetical protein